MRHCCRGSWTCQLILEDCHLEWRWTRMLRTILKKKIWKQHPTKQQVCGHLTPFSKIIQVKWTRRMGLCWRSKDELMNYVFLWTLRNGRTSVGRPARTYLIQLCADTGCSLENLPGVMNDRDGWGESQRNPCWHHVPWQRKIYIHLMTINFMHLQKQNDYPQMKSLCFIWRV